jgi:ribosomal protein S19
MVGYKFGEFTWNRKISLYKSKQKRKKLKKKKKNKIWAYTTNILN